MPETTPLIKAALNLRGGAGFDVYEKSATINSISTCSNSKNSKTESRLLLKVITPLFLLAFCHPGTDNVSEKKNLSSPHKGDRRVPPAPFLLHPRCSVPDIFRCRIQSAPGVSFLFGCRKRCLYTKIDIIFYLSPCYFVVLCHIIC